MVKSTPGRPQNAPVEKERWECKGIVVRVPDEVHRALVREQARGMMETGEKRSLEGIILGVLEGWRGAD